MNVFGALWLHCRHPMHALSFTKTALCSPLGSDPQNVESGCPVYGLKSPAAPPAAQVVDVQPPEQEMVPAVTLQVPAGAGPGSVVSYTLPDGRAVAVTIPPNLKPGDRFPFVPPR